MCRSLAEGGRRCPAWHRPGHNAMRRARRTVERLKSAGIMTSLANESDERFYWWDRGSGAVCARSKIKPLRDPRAVPWKPEGGLWTAPALSGDLQSTASTHSGFHTSWTDYVAAEELHDPGAPTRGNLTEISPAYDAVVVRISTADDLGAARRRWPLTVASSDGETIAGFSYRAMQRDGVDAVDIAPTPETAARGALLYAFDAATRLWLTPHKHCAGERTPLRW